MITEEREIELKDGRKAVLRSPAEEDIDSMLDYLRAIAGETEFVLRYPEECDTYTWEGEKALFDRMRASDRDAMMVCVADGRVVGMCHVAFGERMKTRHRGTVVIALLREVWNQGIGTRMFEEMIRIAEERREVTQLELGFIEGNTRARALYEKMGFRICGLHPNAMHLRDGSFRHEYLMIREIQHDSRADRSAETENEEMTLEEAIHARHSVRSFLDVPVPEKIRKDLETYRDELCRDTAVQIRLVWDEPDGFDSRLAHYGHFRNVRNYIVLSAPKGTHPDEEAGYLGEHLVLRAQQLGLRTCWAALTFNRKAVRRMMPEGHELIIVIALGYGSDDGRPHKNQNMEKLAVLSPGDPDWYRAGVEAALTAPTAVNQQKFRIERDGNKARLKSTGVGPYLRIDLGIVRCHFEIGAGPGHPAEI